MSEGLTEPDVEGGQDLVGQVEVVGADELEVVEGVDVVHAVEQELGHVVGRVDVVEEVGRLQQLDQPGVHLEHTQPHALRYVVAWGGGERGFI